MRDGVCEAVHSGHVAVVDPAGRLVVGVGDVDAEIYPRSALKPFQAAAALELAGTDLPSDELAIMAASHTGARAHQACVRRLLDRAGLTARMLRCPPALPTDAALLRERPEPRRIAHNCSGKHAGFLLASATLDDDAEHYLSDESSIQRGVLRWVRDVCATDPGGPGVDGCGAPAWRVPVSAVAAGFAALAIAANGPLAAVAAAMRTHPLLVGGHGVVDSVLMGADKRIIAKRGAEGVLGIAVTGGRPLGVAIKISDGAARATAPVAAAVLAGVGIPISATTARPAVLGGGIPHGFVAPTDALTSAARAAG